MKRRPDHPSGSKTIGRGVRLVHEDADLLVVDKAPGILTASPSHANPPTVFDVVKDHARKTGGRGARAWIIHRLDREASGLLVFARSQTAFNTLKEEFRTKRVERVYTAVVQGAVGHDDALDRARGTIRSFLVENARGRVASVPDSHAVARVGPRAGDEPMLAVTHYEVLASGHARTLLRLRLDTGRKNQIRVHLAEHNHPVVGDRAYGSTEDPLRRLALHATTLAFTHPATGKRLRFVSPPPGGFGVIVGTNAAAALQGLEDHATDPPAPPPRPAPRHETSWENVAAWYDALIDETRSDHYRDVILPGALRLLDPAPGQRLLDVACGQGVLCRRLAALGVHTLGIDASDSLIRAAVERSARDRAPATPRFLSGDARDLPTLLKGDAPFDAAACIMALMNIDPIEPVVRGIAAALRPGGRLVAVILHPAFRAPGQSSWAWEDKSRQFRRIDGYLSPGQAPITMNPGAVSSGHQPVTTWTFHRPIQSYVRALADAGLFLDALEEWPSARVSEPGPRAKEENRARREIPMFLALRARRLSLDPPAAQHPVANASR